MHEAWQDAFSRRRRNGRVVIDRGWRVAAGAFRRALRTLTEILEADDPAATVEFSIDQSAEKVPVADVVPLSR